MIEKLKLYLDGAVSYHEACSIFLLTCKNKKLATTLLRKEETDYTREKLRYEIKKVIDSLPAGVNHDSSPQEIKAPASVVELPPPAPIVLIDSSRPEKPKSPLLEEITNKRKELYRQRGHLHGRLHQEEDETKSRQIAKQIIEIQPKIDKLNKDLELLECGQIPSGYLKQHVSAEQYVEIRNTKQYIARYEKQLKTQTDPKSREKTQQLIDKYKTKLQNL